MIKRTNRIASLILIAVSMSAIAPINTLSANAAVNNNSQINIGQQTNNVTLAKMESDSAFQAVDAAMIPTKLHNTYNNVSVNLDTTVSQFEKCGSLSYTLNDAAAEKIAGNLKTNMSAIVLGVQAVKTGGTTMVRYGQMTNNQAAIQKGTMLQQSADTVLAQVSSMAGLSDAQLTELVKTEAKDIPVYKYNVTDGTNIIAQGFAVGGFLGLALNPVDTYNGIEKTAKYNSLAPVPSLPLSGSTAYKKTIDLSDSNINIICDGLNINVMDSANNKVYAINNPVYNMLQISQGAKTSTTQDVLNVIDFSGVSNLKGFTSAINVSSQGVATTVLGISLTTSDSKNLKYMYALPITSYESSMIDDVIDSMNLSAAGLAIKGLIQTGTYTMIPDVKSDAKDIFDNSDAGKAIKDAIDKFNKAEGDIKNGLNNIADGMNKAVDGITDGLNKVSDSMNDLTDELKDKNDDLDNAWDKVVNRFDNEPGWGKKDGYIYYYDKDGVSLKGVQKIKGKTYYFNRVDGAMETGWQIVDGKRCYFDKKKGYELFNQWVQDGDDWYYVGEDGAVIKMDWVQDGGKYYYLKADGKMAKGWLKVDDYWYYFNENGSMAASTWMYSKGKWYYLKDNGQTANDWTQIGDKSYYFKDPSGEMQTGWFRANGNWYCSNDDGSMKTGWAESKDGWCYLDDNTGIMKKNEWVTVNGKTYYFNINGAMVTGSRYIDGTKYVFNSDGSLSN